MSDRNPLTHPLPGDVIRPPMRGALTVYSIEGHRVVWYWGEGEPRFAALHETMRSNWAEQMEGGTVLKRGDANA